MNGLPEDQRDDGEASLSSSDERSDSPRDLRHVGRLVDQQGLAIASPRDIRLPLAMLLRYGSSSSLDESSQKCKQSIQGYFRDKGYSLASSHLPYRNSAHSQRALEGFRMMRESGLMVDVILAAGETRIPAHKSLLVACSPYFHAMFTGFYEKDQEYITLQEIDPEALKVLINYVYTSEVEVSEDNVQTLLPAANLLQMTDVRDACCDFLAAQLHPSNCLGIKAFADLHSCFDLLATATNYIEGNFSEVLDYDEFYTLSADQVVELIQSDTVTVLSEEKIYESVIAWVNFNPKERGKHLSRLMEHVRLPLLSRKYLLERVDSNSLFDAHPNCKDFIIEALKFHLLDGHASLGIAPLPGEPEKLHLTIPFNAERTTLRKRTGKPKIMLAIGGQAPKAIRSVEGYDFQNDKWSPVTEMPTRRCRCGVAVVRGRVFAAGGFNGAQRIRTVDEYDPVRDIWTSAPSMEARRSTLGVAMLNDRIYAVGGFDGNTGLNSAEVLDLSLPASKNPTAQIAERQWRPISNMSTKRSSVGVGVLNGLIYAVGGYDGGSRQCLASVEAYDPDRDVWTKIEDMSARRSGAGVGVLDGILYSVGGHDGPSVRKSVEVYDPNLRQWTSIRDMNFSRRNAGVVANDGLLYVIGGDDGTRHLETVEIYNPRTGVWTVLPSMLTFGKSYCGVCVIDKPTP